MIPVGKDLIDKYTREGWWGNETVIDILYQNAAETPDRIALVDPYNKEQLLGVGTQARELTYQELIHDIDSVAFQMKELGIERDDVVLIQLPNIVESILTLFAAARIGAIPSPLPMQARAHELGHALELTDAKAVVTVARFSNFDHTGMIQQLQQEYGRLKNVIIVGPDVPDDVLSFENLLKAPAENQTPESNRAEQSGPNEIFTLCWTSGTEAEPKGVPRTHNQWIAIAQVVVEGAELFPGAQIHGTFPVINMAGVGGLLIPWVLTGGKFVLHHPFDLESFFSQLIKEDIYYTLMPPALLDTLAKSNKVEVLKQSNLNVVASGSVPLSPWMVRFFQDECSIGIVNFFASNEGVAMFSTPRIFPVPEERATYFPRFGGEGVKFDIPEKVTGGMKSRLVSPETGEVIGERGRIGELGFAGPTVFAGYWKRPGLTEKSFDADGFYLTGDLFSIEGDSKEKYLFHGRLKDLIIRGGFNISPDELEKILFSHPKIQGIAVVGYPDDRLGQRVGAAVVPVKGGEVTLEMIQQYMAEKGVAKYKWPEKLLVKKSLPRNPMQKVMRKDLRKEFI
ncbi:MAG: acyl--CoA ligase [Desulfobacteraceae bacterium]|nr:acyl--CoA ligase [Desulfobacteraceae bacterium]